jgi:hypothetical protein
MWQCYLFIAYAYGKTFSRWERLGKRYVDTISLTHVEFITKVADSAQAIEHSNGA